MRYRLIVQFTACLMICGITGCSHPPAPQAAQATPEILAAPAAWSKIKSGALLVDVRGAEEFSEGHIDGALNIPHSEIAANLNAFGPDKDREIVLYCRSGRRSGIARETLIKNGYRNVYNAGGYLDLADKK